MFSEYMLPEYRLYILISNTITKKNTKNFQDNDEKNSDR